MNYVIKYTNEDIKKLIQRDLQDNLPVAVSDTELQLRVRRSSDGLRQTLTLVRLKLLLRRREVSSLNDELWQKIREAYDLIQRGVCKRINVTDHVTVYSCGTVIRMDVKDVSE